MRCPGHRRAVGRSVGSTMVTDGLGIVGKMMSDADASVTVIVPRASLRRLQAGQNIRSQALDSTVSALATSVRRAGCVQHLGERGRALRSRAIQAEAGRASP